MKIVRNMIMMNMMVRKTNSMLRPTMKSLTAMEKTLKPMMKIMMMMTQTLTTGMFLSNRVITPIEIVSQMKKRMEISIKTI